MNRRKPEVKIDEQSKQAIEAIKKPVDGFVEFLNQHAILSMAIGVVIGQTTKDTVKTLVSGLITPGLQAVLPNTNLQDLVITINTAEFKIGAVIDAIIELIIIMLLLYLIFGVIFKRDDLIGNKKKKSKKK
jgi:large conductance mechanosensitive channel